MTRFGLTICAWAMLLAPAWAQVTVSEGAVAEEAPEQIEIEVEVHSIEVPGITKDLRIVAFEALSIGHETKYMILLPDGYDDSEQRYPVIYMLHGFSQNYTVWPMMGVSEYLDTYSDIIIVMPDVGNSWYINWAENDNDEL
ncbi:MAG: alpha/beta hydrolase-fold protein, partial [Candidatus Hydrogenedentota bacterium]